MGQALYRKYRSKSLDEIVGQEHITQTLQQALKQGRISHAYLFTGPRGVGKTSIARIWAHEINDLPYTDDSAHLDIIEIDAASNRRIDEIRDLRDKVYVAPTSAKYKVYIIDEVHMLTREAFNALLKTLEEPPEHAVFILATTDAHKLPETIISRTQRYSFRPVEHAKVVSHLREIADKESLEVSDEALVLLAEHGEGSFRDSISLLDQASSHGQAVELADVQRLLGMPSVEATQKLLKLSLEGASSAEVMTSLTDLYQQGFQAAAIAKQLGQAIRNQIVQGSANDAVVELLGALIEVPASHNPERFLEITLLQASPRAETPARPQKAAVAEPPVQIAVPEPEPEPPIEAFDEPELELEPEIPVKAAAPEKPKPKKPASSAVLDEALWPALLQALKQKHNTLYSVTRMAEPTFGDNELTLAFAFPFHQKRINEPSSRQLLVDLVQELTGKVVVVTCVVDKSASPQKVALEEAPVVKTEPTPVLSTISNIFGGAELLES